MGGLSPAVLAFFLIGQATQCFGLLCKSSEFGDIVDTNGTKYANRANKMMIVKLSDQPAAYDGFVCSFYINALEKGVDVQFLVLRPIAPANTYTVAHTLTYTTSAVGLIEVKPTNFNFLVRDEFAFVNMGGGTVSMNSTSSGKVSVFVEERNATSPINKGTTVKTVVSTAVNHFHFRVKTSNCEDQCIECGVRSSADQGTIQEQNATVGHDIVPGDFSPTGFRITVLVNKVYPFDGYLCSFSAYFEDLSPIKYQVWRDATPIAGTKTFMLIAEKYYAPVAKGSVTVDMRKHGYPIRFKKGDHVAFANLDGKRSSITAKIKMDYTLFHSMFTKFPVIGEVVSISSVAVTYFYSISANIATDPKYCPGYTPPSVKRCETFGNPTINGTIDDDHSYLHILKKYYLPAGTIKTFNAFLMSVAPVTVQIYRPTGTPDEYILIAEETIIPTAPGPIKIYPSKKIQLQADDKIGFITDVGVLAFNEGIEEIAVKNILNKTRPTPGEKVTVTDIVKRTFSLSVTVDAFDPEINVSHAGGNQPVVDGGDAYPYGRAIYIMVDKPMSPGTLSSVSLYVKSTSPIKLQVWKPAGKPNFKGQDFTLMYEAEASPPSPGLHRFALQKPYLLEGGEYLGVSLDNSSDIASITERGNILGYQKVLAPVSVGETLNITTWWDRKKLSISPDVVLNASITAPAPTPKMEDTVLGYPSVPGQPSPIFPATYVMTSEKVEREARLVCFKLFPVNLSPVHLQIWRRSSDNQTANFTLVHSQAYTPAETGKQFEVAPSSPVNLQLGDLIGFSLTTNGTIANNHVSPGDGYVYHWETTTSVAAVGKYVKLNRVSVTNRFSYSIVTDANGQYLYIMKDRPLEEGHIKTFNAFLKSVAPVTVQIYRPTGTPDEYTLIAEETIIPTAPGQIKIYPRKIINVHKDDVLGFMAQDEELISRSGGQEEIAMKAFINETQPSVGHNITVPDIIKDGFSFSATIGSFDPDKEISHEGGNEPVVNGSGGLPYNHTVYIMVDEPMSPGTLTSVRLYAKSTSPIKLQVWKPAGGLTLTSEDFTLQHQVEVVPPSAGKHKFVLQTPFPLEGGEFLGVQIQNDDVIATITERGNLLGVKQLQLSDNTTVGDTHTISQWLDKKKISLSPDVLVNTTVAKPEQYKYGWGYKIRIKDIDVKRKPYQTSLPSTFIMTSAPVENEARLHSFKLLTENLFPVHLQIWRRTSDDSFRLVHTQEYTPTKTGEELEVAANSTVVLHPGDMIGFTSTNTNGTIAQSPVSVAEGYRYAMRSDMVLATTQEKEYEVPKVVATSVFAYTIVTDTFGNPIRDGADDDDHLFLHVLKGHPLPDGTVKTFNAFLKSVVPVTVQIYRPTGTPDEYTLIAEETIIPTARGSIKIYPRKQIETKDGDVIGFITENHGSLAFTEGMDEIAVRNIMNETRPSPGDNVLVPKIVKRMFSLSVTVDFCEDHIEENKASDGPTNATIGHPVVSGSFTPKGRRMVLLYSDPIPLDGVVCSFSGYFQDQGAVKFQLWRETTGHQDKHRTFRLLSEKEYTPSAKEAATVSLLNETNTIQVQKGDYIGFANLEQNRGSISSNFPPGRPATLFRHRFSAFPTVGEAVEFPTVTVTYLYSISAYVASSRDRCPGEEKRCPVEDLFDPTKAISHKGGNEPVVNGSDGLPYNHTVYIMVDEPMSAGTLTSVRLYAKSTSPIKLQVWKPAGGLTLRSQDFTLQHQVDVIPTGPGEHKFVFQTPFPLDGGEFLGVQIQNDDVIATINERGNLLGVKQLQSSDNTTVGETHTISQWLDKKKISLSPDILINNRTNISTTAPPVADNVLGFPSVPGQSYQIQNPTTFIMTSEKVTYDARIVSFKLLANNLHPVHLQIWRMTSGGENDTYSLVYTQEYTPSETGKELTVQPSSEVELHPGDLIGFTLTKNGTIAVNHVSVGDGYVYAMRSSSELATTGGKEYKVPEIVTTNTFSYSVILGQLPASTTALPTSTTTTQAPTTTSTTSTTTATETTTDPNEIKTIGPSIDAEPKLPGENGNKTFILDNFDLPEGYLYKFNVFLNTTDPVTFKIFRPDPKDPNILNVAYEIGPFQAPYAPGFFDVYASPPKTSARRRRRSTGTASVKTQKGDKLGFTVSGKNPVPITPSKGGSGSGSGSGVRFIVVPSNPGQPVDLRNAKVSSGVYVVNVAVTKTPQPIPVTTTTQAPTTTTTPINFQLIGNPGLGGGSPAFGTNRIRILRGFDIPSGWVRRFEMHLTTNDTFKAQIWRPDPKDPSQYTLVDEMEFQAANGPGLYSAYPEESSPIKTESGDKLGFTCLGKCPLYARAEQDAGADCGIIDLNLISGYPVVGTRVTLTGVSYNEKYPIAVEISSSYLPPPSPTPFTLTRVGSNITTDGQKGQDGTTTYIFDYDLVDGYVYRFNAYLATPDAVKLQVFRPTGGATYKLIGEVEAVAKYGPGDYRIYPNLGPIAVKKNDRIGFTTNAFNPVTYKIEPGTLVHMKPNLDSLPVVGDNIKTTAESYQMEYNINVDIASSLVDPPIGPVGPKGNKGSAGVRGEQGIKGTNGVKGTKGGMGLKGQQGPTGVIGFKGGRGPKGSQGSAGLQGSRGSKGDLGDLGVVGVTGVKGAIGITGTDGTRGVTGAKGDLGSQGLTGVTGPQGKNGPAGVKGMQGPQGKTGPKGKRGHVGPVPNATCSFSNGGCSHVCTEVLGAVICSCNPGYELQNDSKTCLDVDECVVNNGMCEQNCSHVSGLPVCSCSAGFTISLNKRHCNDIDECLTSPCDTNSICLNTRGSYMCYKGRGTAKVYNEQGNTAALSSNVGLAERNVLIGLIVWSTLITIGTVMIGAAFFWSSKESRKEKKQMDTLRRSSTVGERREDPMSTLGATGEINGYLDTLY